MAQCFHGNLLAHLAERDAKIFRNASLTPE